jgi:hypothetical protein
MGMGITTHDAGKKKGRGELGRGRRGELEIRNYELRIEKRIWFS